MLSSTNQNSTIGACQSLCMLGIVGCRLLVVVHHVEGLLTTDISLFSLLSTDRSPILVCTNRSVVSLMSDLSERSPLGLLTTPSQDLCAHQQTYAQSLACSQLPPVPVCVLQAGEIAAGPLETAKELWVVRGSSGCSVQGDMPTCLCRRCSIINIPCHISRLVSNRYLQSSTKSKTTTTLGDSYPSLSVW